MRKLVLLICLALSLSAKTLSYEVSAKYIMGDNDTKIEARKIALEQAKKIALEQAGTYMEVKTIVKNGRLTTDEIKSFGASVLKTKIKNEKYFFDGNTPVLEILVESEIDMEILKQNIEQAKKNKDELIKRVELQKENAKLLREIEALKNDFNSREKRNELITKIEENNNILVKAFKKGSLLSLSHDYDAATNKALEDIRVNFFKFLQNNIRVEIGNIQVENNGDNTSNVIVDVNWDLENKADLIRFLDNYFELDSSEVFKENKYSVLESGKRERKEANEIDKITLIHFLQKSKKIDQLKLLQDLQSKQVLIKVVIGEKTKYIVVATGGNLKHTGYGESSYVTDFGVECYLLLLKGQNSIINELPVEFENISNSILADIDKVHTEVIATKPTFKTKKFKEKTRELLERKKSGFMFVGEDELLDRSRNVYKILMEN